MPIQTELINNNPQNLSVHYQMLSVPASIPGPRPSGPGLCFRSELLNCVHLSLVYKSLLILFCVVWSHQPVSCLSVRVLPLVSLLYCILRPLRLFKLYYNLGVEHVGLTSYV